MDFIHAFSSDYWIHLSYGRIEAEDYSETYRILFRGKVESLLAINVIDKYVCFKPLAFNINEEYKKQIQSAHQELVKHRSFPDRETQFLDSLEKLKKFSLFG